MTIAEAEPTGASPDDLSAGQAELPPEGEAVVPETPVGPACPSCGAALAEAQDWCLECGTAVSATRRRRIRGVGVATALAVLLTGGAVAASYAALSDEPPPRETQVTTVATAAPAPVETTTTTTPPVEDVEPLPPTDDVQPVEPVQPVQPVTPVTPTQTTPTATTPTTTPDKETEAKPKAPEFTPITVDVGDGSLYDPDKRATAAGDPQRALDISPGSSWFATTPADGDMNVGYVVDLGKSKPIKRLELVTKTPGFTIRVLGARGGKPPAQSDDAAWVVLGEAGSVDAKPATGAAAPAVAPAEGDKAGDTRLRLDLAADDEIFRHILLWVSVPPSAGPTVRFSTIRLLQ